MASSSSSMVNGLPRARPQVFINFRGEELRKNFICHLEVALKNDDIKYFIDTKAGRGEDLQILFQMIEESQIALAVFSKRYSESDWCLDELVKIMERVEEKKLIVIPIFFNVEVEDVQQQRGDFGLNLYGGDNREIDNMPKWKKALRSVPSKMGLTLTSCSSESDLVAKIVKSVKEVIAKIEAGEGTNMLSKSISSLSSSESASSGDINQPRAAPPRNGLEECLKQLEKKLNFECEETQIVGIVGMPGIGKTTLAEYHLDKWDHRFVVNEIFHISRENSEDHDWVRNKLLNAQLRPDNEIVKVFVVLDGVSNKNQVEFLRTNRELVKKGSKIVITTGDKGLLEGLDDDPYEVPGLDDKEALQLFIYHAFNDQDYPPTDKFITLSKRFVDYAGGNPRALEELGKEICGKSEADWNSRVETLPYCCNKNTSSNLTIIYRKLTLEQKHAFLDIGCFFRSEEEDYVRILLDSYDDSGKAAPEVTDLEDKFLISISAGRVEMPNILCSLGKEIGSPQDNLLEKSRLWNHQDAVIALTQEKVLVSARGIFLDMSKIEKGIALGCKALIRMPNLRYIKIYDSRCPRQCDLVESKVNFPDGLEFSLKELRYLHWLKFPGKELPSDFNTQNLIDLRLPYSKLQQVWGGVKDTPKLKWVDLSHSTKLTNLSALSNAESLRRLNLEGCSMLANLPEDIENMKSLGYLNLKGCTSLLFLPGMTNLISLKTLILSDCSNLNEFHVISRNLEFLHLDGTAIKELPLSIQNLRRLIVLNLKDCKKLESLPDCLGM